MAERKGIIAICGTATFKVGDPAPSGYADWHEWAKVQYQGGLRQHRGPDGKWCFPQEMPSED